MRDVRAVASSLLGDLSYSVLEAEIGRDALVLIERGQPVDLVVTDVIMPGDMNGINLVRELKTRHAGIPALMTSGYTAQRIVAEDMVEGLQLLRKPYDQVELLLAARLVLNDPGSSSSHLLHRHPGLLCKKLQEGIRLPVAPQKSSCLVRPHRPDQGLDMNAAPKPCVLVAEDEPMVSMLLEELLESAGYRVLLAEHLSDGLALVTNESIDVAILDVTLGREQSFPIADELGRRHIPFLFASGYGMDGIPARYHDAAMLQKPYDMKSILLALEKLQAGT
ncbi:MAG TPA: response regulator [Rhodanobacter sp.]